jgi:hypothetical protein
VIPFRLVDLHDDVTQDQQKGMHDCVQ